MSSAARRLRRQRPERRCVDGGDAARALARVALGVCGAAGGMRLGARAQRWIGPARLTMQVGLARTGGTRVELPPLGTAALRTHRGPLRLRITAGDIDPDRAQGLLREGAALRDTLRGAEGEVRDLARTAATRAVLAGVGGAALAGGVAGGLAGGAAGAAAGSALLAGAGAYAARTFDRDAWRDPRLTGLLTKLPVLLGDLRTAPERVDTYRKQLAELVRTGTDVYRHVLELPEGPPDDAIRLLHISDIHLSPMTYPLVAALVTAYRVDVVVDTGDLVDWGTAPERAFADQIGALSVPYVFVKGNHDSTGIADAVAAQSNATVFDIGSPPLDIAGLRFAGMADPRFTPDKTTGDDHAEHRVSERAERFAESLGATEVDVLLAHDPAAATALAGHAPLFLAGHTHRRAARRVGDTVVLTQGSSGGSGLRGVQQDPPTPHALSIVYVDRRTKHVWGTDEITLGGLGSVRLSVERRSLADLLGESGRAPVGVDR